MSEKNESKTDESSIFEQIKERLAEVGARIEESARRSGRSKNDVLLTAVTKYSGPNDGIVEGFLRSGIYDLAENRPQKFMEKALFWNQSQWGDVSSTCFFRSANERTSDDVPVLRWHFIGNLQRNKARRILPFVSLIHSVDSWKLLETLERILREEAERPPQANEPSFPKSVSVLLEAHISNDVSKQGMTLEEIEDVFPKAFEFEHVKVCGLMGMAGLTATPDETRRQFASLRNVLERIQNRYPEFKHFRELSMGMSGDFETAIEEGSTIVRIGSILYPKRS
ncbi:MAG: YggS family pyridoxal phosphate-dependent enzyme [Thermoguttaceae bacterium]|nr:YggS family pyridoxal phosphate-dependent enzyme [Thermoguttaceae bacterium]